MATTEYNGVTLRFPNTEKPYIARAYVPGGINPRQKLIGRFATAEEAHVERERFRRDQARRQKSREEIEEEILGPTLPSQISKGVKSPAILLRAAVVEQAKKDLESPNEKIAEEARRWFLGLYECMPTFSFAEICDLCDASAPKAARRLGCWGSI